MRTRTSIKSTEFFSSFQARLGLNKSGVKRFVSAIRNGNLIKTKEKPSEHKDRTRSNVPSGSKHHGRNSKFACSLCSGFEKIISTYNSFFRAGQKTQQNNAHQYLQGIFCAERGKRNIERMVEEAEKNAAEDKVQMERVEARNGLESYLYNTRNTVREDKVKETLGSTTVKEIEDWVQEGISWLEANPEADKDQYTVRKYISTL